MLPQTPRHLAGSNRNRTQAVPELPGIYYIGGTASR